MKTKLACFLVVMIFITLPAVQAKESATAQKPESKSNEKMSVYQSPEMRRMEEAKKNMEAALSEVSFAQKVEEKVAEVIELVADKLDKVLTKEAPQKGDPKTVFSQSENKMHSARHMPEVVYEMDLTQWDKGPTTVNGSVAEVIYYAPLDASSLYTYIAVQYDTITGEPLQAVGYTEIQVTEMPDITGMTTTGTNTYTGSSGTIVVTSYVLLPLGSESLSQAVQWVDVYSTSYGRFLFAYVKTKTDLDLVVIKIPSYY